MTPFSAPFPGGPVLMHSQGAGAVGLDRSHGPDLK
jgi:hypothetical protein